MKNPRKPSVYAGSEAFSLAGAQNGSGVRTAPPMRFSDEKHARLCGSPYENKRPPNGGLLFWQGHKGSNSGHAVLETAKKV